MAGRLNDVSAFGAAERGRLQKLLERAQQKGIATDKVLAVVEMYGLLAAEETIAKSTKGQKDGLGFGTKGLADIAKKPAAPAPTAKPSFWPGQTGQKTVMIELPPETLEKARVLLNISDDVWTAMLKLISESTLVEVIDFALVRRGYADGLAGVKSLTKNEFWGTYTKG